MQQNEQVFQLDLQQQKLDKLQFVCSIQCKELSTDPNHVQCEFTQQNGDVVLVIKITSMCAYIRLRGKNADQVQRFEEKGLRCLAFRMLDYETILKGNEDGSIFIKALKQDKILKRLNVLRNDTVYMQRRVHRMHAWQDQFAVLFVEGVVMLFNRQYPNGYVIESEKLMRLSFKEHKREMIVQNKVLKDFKEGSYKFLNYGEFTAFAVCNNEKVNPIWIYRFEATQLNEIEILPYSPLENLNQRMENGLCVALSGLDGYFRLMDLKNAQPLFSFKTDHGGICSFAFSMNFKLVCLATQEDAAYVINFENQISWLKIVGHRSFISRGVFSSISGVDIRLICTSYDGTLSVTDIDLQQFKREEGLFVKASDCEGIQAKNIIDLGRDGVSYCAEYQNYIATIHFDGYVRIYQLQ